MNVLEIGSGQGNFSALIASQAAELTVSDISPYSLKVASKFLKEFDNIKFKEADMENLPFLEDSFDVIVMSGSLSYGKFEIVNNQILKVLRDDGLFIFVDSLNNNPIYKYKRYLDTLTGKRSTSTYKNLPTLGSIETLSNDFKIIDIKYFGSLTWVFKFFPDKKWVRSLSDSFDELIRCRKSAYKLTFIGKKFSS
jgi:ubiquinone/menaquinone biosynthesis C-methylase UbiE